MMKTIDELNKELGEQLESCVQGKACVEDVPADYGERYFLAELCGDSPLICFGVNPSTANANKDDPTIRKVRSIADYNKLDGWIMLNLYPQRATDPDEMHKECHQDIVEKNNAVIAAVLHRFSQGKVMAAWGDLIEKRGYLQDCLEQILKLDGERKWYRLDPLTSKKNPRHPLSVIAKKDKNGDEKKDKMKLVPYEDIRGRYGL